MEARRLPLCFETEHRPTPNADTPLRRPVSPDADPFPLVVDIYPALLKLVGGLRIRIPPCDECVSTAVIDKMKAYELFSSPETWRQEALAKDARDDNVRPFNPKAVQWCALAAVQMVYPPVAMG
jgi:hypothetical protein